MLSALTKTATVSRPEACLTPDRYSCVQFTMPPKSSSRRSPKDTRRKSPRQHPPATGYDVNARRAEDDEDEDDVDSEDNSSVDENPHASVQALTKIREALSGLSQEQVQILLKGVPTRPLQLDEKAQATASLDRAVHTFLWLSLIHISEPTRPY